VTDPKHPEHSSDSSDPGDPDSLPVLTDVLVEGRPPMPRPTAQHEPDAATRSEPSMHESARSFATAEQQEARRPTESSTEAVRAAQIEEFVEPVAAAPSTSAEAPADTPVEAPIEASTTAEQQAEVEVERQAKAEQDATAKQQAQASAPLSAAPAVELPAAEDLSERDAEQLAERLRVRFAGYLREEGRAVIEARCRDALQEHTSWLVRQVTREVALALEGEVVGWVRDAVREELAAHRASRRPGA
jgi:hypothetical protein